MPANVSLMLRQRIQALVEGGSTATAIARELKLSPRTVRQLCRRLKSGGEKALIPSYPRPELCDPTEVIRQALLLRQQHSTWGAAYILIRLQ